MDENSATQTTDPRRAQYEQEWRHHMAIDDPIVWPPQWIKEPSTEAELRANAAYCLWLTTGRCDDLGRFIIREKAMAYLGRADAMAGLARA